MWIVTTSTGKSFDMDKVAYDLLSRDKSKGTFLTILDDGTEIYLSVEEYKEILEQTKKGPPKEPAHG